jgi:ubiquinone/menaquinone biosynthesis C-methylase UbiE
MSRLDDPVIPPWSQIQLPATWPDQLHFSSWRERYFFIKKFLRVRSKVQIPENLWGREVLPPYLLQEFHHLPNGNYSIHGSRNYLWGFDLSMLGQMKRARRYIARKLSLCTSVLDIGCGGGQLSQVLRKKGIEEVWGLDPCPYFLKRASERFPHIPFVQGLAEATGFPSERFDGIAFCFVFHELPRKIARQSLEECYRILKVKGKIAIVEPSPQQFNENRLHLLWKWGGWMGFYFRVLAKVVYEPFVRQWHQQDISRWAQEGGFEVLEDSLHLPFRYILLQKREKRE